MSSQISVLTILLATYWSFSYADFCNLSSCQGKPHTMCQYHYEYPAVACKTVLQGGLLIVERERILNLHNELRQKVASGTELQGNPGPQPAAANMATLQWDNELELIAQRWANQCLLKNDQCRDVDLYPVGQNYGFFGTTLDTFTIEDLVHVWYNEVKYFNKTNVPKYVAQEKFSQYTQLVWAKTTNLGCGAMKYTDCGLNQYFLVCNYGPLGNIENQPIYETK